MDEGIFSPTTVTTRFGIKYTTLDLWIRSGFFVPSVTAEGKGTKRRFSFFDILQIQLIAYLKEIGVNSEFLQFILGIVREEKERVMDSSLRTLAVTDGKAFLKFYEELPEDFAVSIPVLLIPIGTIKSAVLFKLEKKITTTRLIEQHEALRKGDRLSEQ